MEDTMALIPQSRDTLSHPMGEGGPSQGYGPARRGEGIVYPILRTPQSLGEFPADSLPVPAPV